MSKEAIVEKIILDAKIEADAMVSAAMEKANEQIALATSNAKKNLEQEKEQISAQADSILERMSATIRLEESKIELAQKHRIVDEIYAKAYEALLNLSKESYLSFVEKLIAKYADNGDVLVLSSDCKYKDEVAALPILKEKQVKLSKEFAKMDGGFMLQGKTCDKDLSFKSLLEEDKNAHCTTIINEILK